MQGIEIEMQKIDVEEHEITVFWQPLVSAQIS